MDYLLMIKPSLILGFVIIGVAFYCAFKYADHCDKKNSKQSSHEH